MKLTEQGGDFDFAYNVDVCLRDQRGRVVPGSRRRGHNVFTITGRNWLTKLMVWNAIRSYPPGDEPFTQRRIRWIGVGIGTQLEVTNVPALVSPVQVTSSYFLVPLDSVEFPTSASMRVIKTFGAVDISYGGGPAILVSEAGLFVDVAPAAHSPAYNNDGVEDDAAPGTTTTLDPAIGSNPPITYKTFEPLPKTQDYSLELIWEFRL